MVSTGELGLVIFFIVILVGFIIYLVVAHSNQWWPFNPYYHPLPDDPDRVFQPVTSITKLTEAEQNCNKWIVCQPPYASDKKPSFCNKEPFVSISGGKCPCSDAVCNASAGNNQ